MGTENELSERPATFFCSPQPLFSVQESAFDPDLVLSTGNDNQGIEVFGMPTTRSLGFTLTCEF